MKKKEEYQGLLKDPRWIYLSREIRNWDRNHCCLCGNSGRDAKLQVHHLYYDKSKMPWEYDRKALITVCEKCHRKLHESEQYFYENLHNLLNELGELGYTKCAIIHILELIVQMSKDKKSLNELYGFLTKGVPLQDLMLVHCREHKNDMHELYEKRHQACLDHARKAHEWATHRNDFSEEDYYCGYYDDEIREYNDYFSD